MRCSPHQCFIFRTFKHWIKHYILYHRQASKFQHRFWSSWCTNTEWNNVTVERYCVVLYTNFSVFTSCKWKHKHYRKCECTEMWVTPTGHVRRLKGFGRTERFYVKKIHPAGSRNTPSPQPETLQIWALVCLNFLSLSVCLFQHLNTL